MGIGEIPISTHFLWCALDFMCFVRFPLVLKLKLQCLHVYGRTLVCVLPTTGTDVKNQTLYMIYVHAFPIIQMERRVKITFCIILTNNFAPFIDKKTKHYCQPVVPYVFLQH